MGQGSEQAELFVVLAGPSPEDDSHGRFASGARGELLQKMLAAMGLRPEQVFVSGLVRCGSAAPDEVSLQKCTPFLRTELVATKPKFVLVMGEAPSQFLLKAPLDQTRGWWSQVLGVPTMATWGLEQLLPTAPNQGAQDEVIARKRQAWADLQKIMKRLAH